jgi:hypothetical protein
LISSATALPVRTAEKMAATTTAMTFAFIISLLSNLMHLY